MYSFGQTGQEARMDSSQQLLQSCAGSGQQLLDLMRLWSGVAERWFAREERFINTLRPPYSREACGPPRTIFGSAAALEREVEVDYLSLEVSPGFGICGAKVSRVLHRQQTNQRVKAPQAHRHIEIPLPTRVVVLGRILQQPTLFNPGNVADKRLIARLHDFVKDDPVGLAVLRKLSAK